MAITITQLFSYPIKGLSAESVPQVTLSSGRAIPGDRRFALRHAASAFEAAAPTWQPKREFAMLAHTAELAKLHTSFDADTATLRIGLNGNTLFIGNVLTEAGRRGADSVINAVIKDARGALHLVDAGEIALTDCQTPYLSIINLASVRDFAAKTGQAVDAARFRGNIIIDGLAPWAEFNWVGKTTRIGGVSFTIAKRIGRCSATTVNLATAQRDLDVPALLCQHYGHIDCGVYGTVGTGGTVRVGDVITVS